VKVQAFDSTANHLSPNFPPQDLDSPCSENKSIRPLPHRPYHGSTPCPPTPPQLPPDTPIALWRVAETFLHTLHALFGTPEDVAAEHTLVAKAHKLMASWLRCAEAMLRRLLLIEASAHAEALRPVRRSSESKGGSNEPENSCQEKRRRERKLLHSPRDRETC
jgi:hypothetical protein